MSPSIEFASWREQQASWPAKGRHILAQHDHVVPYAASRDVVRLVGSSDKQEWVIKGGHVSVIAGLGAVTRTWPQLVGWLAPRSV